MQLVVSSPPHLHCGLTEAKIDRDFFIALLPAIAYAIYIYRWHALGAISLAAAAALASHLVIRKLLKKPVSYSASNALVTGILFALLLPPGVPFQLIIFGAFLCIFAGTEIFGGRGSNPLNPVFVGWAIIEISWPHYFDFNLAAAAYDLGFDYHYPLTLLKKGGTAVISNFSYLDLCLGKQVGGMGAVCLAGLLLGGIYLLLRRVIDIEIPLSFATGVVVMGLIFWYVNPGMYADPVFHLLTGNVVIAMFFLANDYGSSPFTRWGKVLFGFGCGSLTVIFRAWSIHIDGVVYAVLIMNLFTPLLDKINKKKYNVNVKVNYL